MKNELFANKSHIKIDDLNILVCQFLGADKVSDGNPLLVHRVEVLDVVVKEVVRAGGKHMPLNSI